MDPKSIDRKVADMDEEQKICEDRLQIALANAYAAYMRGLYRDATRKNLDLLCKAMGMVTP